MQAPGLPAPVPLPWGAFSGSAIRDTRGRWQVTGGRWSLSFCLCSRSCLSACPAGVRASRIPTSVAWAPACWAPSLCLPAPGALAASWITACHRDHELSRLPFCSSEANYLLKPIHWNTQDVLRFLHWILPDTTSPQSEKTRIITWELQKPRTVPKSVLSPGNTEKLVSLWVRNHNWKMSLLFRQPLGETVRPEFKGPCTCYFTSHTFNSLLCKLGIKVESVSRRTIGIYDGIHPPRPATEEHSAPGYPSQFLEGTSSADIILSPFTISAAHLE